MKLYLAGPMRGYPEFNFPAFFAAEWRIELLGHRVFNPAREDVRGGFDPTGLEGTDAELERLGFDMGFTFRRDVLQITNYSEGIVLLPGWRKSGGACFERDLGERLGLKIVSYKRLLREGKS